jgi:hypothetical protein
MKKDHRGSQLIRLLSIPQAATFPRRPRPDGRDGGLLRTRRAGHALHQQGLRPLSEDELLDYHVNERINDRGVLVDVPLCKAAVKYASDELVEIEQIVAEVTEGAITSVRSPKMRQWVIERVGPQALKLMETYKDGEMKYSIDKTVRANLLNCEDVPPDVQEVIQCADDLWASSVAKFSRLASLADVEDNRVRGAFVFAGGSATGRASSYGAQVHNFTRKCAESPEDVRTAMVRGHSIVPRFGKRVTDVLKGMLRPALIPAPRVSPWSWPIGPPSRPALTRGSQAVGMTSWPSSPRARMCTRSTPPPPLAWRCRCNQRPAPDRQGARAGLRLCRWRRCLCRHGPRLRRAAYRVRIQAHGGRMA